jgi:hypothetical protein
MRTTILISILLGLVLITCVQSVPAARAVAQPARQRTRPFEVAKIYLEFNATDNDMGVHIDSDHEAGLRSLQIRGPRGVVINQTWKSRPTLGLTEMKTESSEPDAVRALHAYPPGVYFFTGSTVDGKRLSSQATFSHDLLDAPTITSPSKNAGDLPVNGVTVSWDAVPGAAAYHFELTDETEDAVNPLDLDAVFPASVTEFRIPDGLLKPGTTYGAGAASIHVNGNQTLSVVTFSTAD